MNSPIQYFNTQNPPALDQSKRSGILSVNAIRDRASQFSSSKNPGHIHVATGILLLWHDHWDEAHTVAQSHEGDPDHDFLHGMVHRREGDFGNSKYWFRSAGVHPCLSLIATRVTAIVNNHALANKLLTEGVWNPTGFVDAVRNHTRADEEICRTIQAAEMIGFYEWLTGDLS
jgi:hypothetical protein